LDSGRESQSSPNLATASFSHIEEKVAPVSTRKKMSLVTLIEGISKRTLI
jgi:hypothetical protein